MKTFLVILITLVVSACGTRTYTMTSHTPDGVRNVKVNEGPYSSDTSVVIETNKAFRECVRYNAPTMGSSQADMYCRSATGSTPGGYTPGGYGQGYGTSYGPQSGMMMIDPGRNMYAGSMYDASGPVMYPTPMYDEPVRRGDYERDQRALTGEVDTHATELKKQQPAKKAAEPTKK